MKIHLLSDLHNEFDEYAWDIPETDANVIVLAGDIGVGIPEVEWAIKQSKLLEKPIVMIAGNHTYYHQDFDTILSEYKKLTRGTNVHFLENQSVVIDGVAFIGCTLWTDFDGTNNQAQAMHDAPSFLNDYHVIKRGLSGALRRNLTPEDTKAKFDESRKYLDFALEQYHKMPTVVVTHHGPSILCHDGKKYGVPNEISVNFWSDLEYMIKHWQPPIWCYGHTHSSIKFKLGKTRIVSNQRGYGRECIGEFDPTYTITV